MTPLRCLRAMALTLLLSAAVSPALAQTPAPAQPNQEQLARELFDRAREQLKQADYAAAASSFAASFRASPLPSALILQADCEERLGKLHTASQLFVRGAQLADEAGDANDPELAERARTRAAALAPRIPELELRVPVPLPPGLQVTLDGAEVPAQRLNAPMQLDAGLHALKARAPGYADFASEVQVDNGPSATPGPQVVALTLVQSAAPAAQSAAPVKLPAELQPDPFAPGAGASAGREDSRWLGIDRRTFAWIAGGVGVAAGLGGVALIASASGNYDDSKASCQEGSGDKLRCTPHGIRLQEKAVRKANWATAAAVVATAGLGAGVYAYVTSEDGSTMPTAVGIRLQGRF